MSIQSNFDKSILGVNSVYGDIISNDNISCKGLTGTTGTFTTLSCNNESVSGDLNCNGNLSLNGTSSQLSISGLNSSLYLSGNSNILGTLSIGGNATFTNNIQGNKLIQAGVGNAIYLNGDNLQSINNQGLWLQWNRVSGDGRTYIINQRGSGNGGFSFGESTTSNVYTENMSLSSTGILRFLNSYQNTYQTKALLSTSGTLNNYPSWTTTSATSTSGTITFTIGDNTNTPYFDTTNYSKIKIHFQGHPSTSGTLRPNLFVYPLINGANSTSNMECSVYITNRTTNAILSLITTNTAVNCQIFQSLENQYANSFGGCITFYLPFGSGVGNEFEVDCSYLRQGVGSSRVFGSFRSLNTSSLNFNGISFVFNNLDTSSQTINFKYYIEHL